VNHENTVTNAHTFLIGTPPYVAPEQYSPLYDGKYNFKVDIYALGIFIMEFFTLFNNKDEKIVAIKELRNDNIPDSFFKIVNKSFMINKSYSDLKRLIIKMTKSEPNERPNIDDLKLNFGKFLKLNYTFILDFKRN